MGFCGRFPSVAHASQRLRRYLRDKGFGYLQNSVWITPDPLAEERQILGGGKINVESLLLLEARPCAGESDAEIVTGAWDFERINRRYARHLIRRSGVSGERRILCVGRPDGGALPRRRYGLVGRRRRSARRGWTR